MAKTQSAAASFLAKKVQIDELLAQLQARSADHFGVDPDQIHWGHVGDVSRLLDLLTEASRAA